NAIQPRDNYKVLIDHYRDEYERHGHAPRYAYVAAGSNFLFLADTTQEARERYGPVYEQMVALFNRPGNHTPGNEMTFTDIDDAIARGPVLVGVHGPTELHGTDVVAHDLRGGAALILAGMAAEGETV